MLKGLSWDQTKVRIAALLALATMAIPGVAAADEAGATTASVTVGADAVVGVGTYSFPAYARGTSWT